MKTAGFLALLLLWPVAATAAEIVIEAGALAPVELSVDFGETVRFANRSGRLAHIEFAPHPEGHHVFQIPGLIRVTFHRSGRHPYVVHLDDGVPRAELRGVVTVAESRTSNGEPLVCRGQALEGICVEP